MADEVLSPDVGALLNAALVAELTAINPAGRPVSYPLIPLYDGRRIYFTSAVLFSKKFEHIKANPKVSVSLSDPAAMTGVPWGRACIQGDATVLDTEDPHSAWERLLPMWTAKEPAIAKLVKQRFGLPLFFERHIIEVAPTREFFWPGGDTAAAPRVFTCLAVEG